MTEGATDETGYETATYMDEAGPNHVRPRARKQRAVMKDGDASDDPGYETATYTDGVSHVHPVLKAKREADEDFD